MAAVGTYALLTYGAVVVVLLAVGVTSPWLILPALLLGWFAMRD